MPARGRRRTRVTQMQPPVDASGTPNSDRGKMARRPRSAHVRQPNSSGRSQL